MSRPSPRRRPVASVRVVTGTGRRRRVVRTLGRAAVVASAALLSTAGACGRDTADPPPPSSPPGSGTTIGTAPPATAASSTTTTAAAAGDEAEVRAVIDRYWAAWFAATAYPPDPDHPELNAVLTGDARARIIGGVQRRRDEGTFVRLPPGSLFSRRIDSVSIAEDGVATVVECVVDDSESVSSSTGETLRAGLATLTFTSALVRVDGTWRITATETTEKQEGVSACAV